MSDTISDFLNTDPQPILRDVILDLINNAVRGFHVHGVEVTQGIQYYRSSAHLSDPTDCAPDNSVRLIAGKPAWVRVYVRSGFLYPEIPDVTGTLTVIRRKDGAFYRPPGITLTPQPLGATVTALRNPVYREERGNREATLNFVIPANEMCGFLQLKVSLSAPGGHTAERTIYVHATLQQTLRLAGIMVAYDGPASTASGAQNRKLDAPTKSDLQRTSALTLRIFPVESTADYYDAGTIMWNLPLNDARNGPGGCSPNWSALNAAVQVQKVADGNRSDVLYYGLLPSTVPRLPVSGCTSGDVSSGPSGMSGTMAHELGHACGLPHSPCDVPGDPTYPVYEPYDPWGTPTASIGEYGLDIANGRIYSPALIADFMSYCHPSWISLYNYGRLTNNPSLSPVQVCIDHIWWRDHLLEEGVSVPGQWPDPRRPDREPVISIIGLVHSDAELEIKSLMRTHAERGLRGSAATDLTVELLNEAGRIVASAPAAKLQSHGACGCQCAHAGSHETQYPYLFQAFVSDVEPGAALRIRRGEKVLWSRTAPDAKPHITGFKAVLRTADRLFVEWQIAGTNNQETEYWLQWSKDRGKTWNALTTGLRGNKSSVSGSALSSGRVLVRLLASDGFYTAESRHVSVLVPARAPAVSILSPRDGQTLVAGDPTRLWGVGTSDKGERILDKSAQWILDGKASGNGFDVFTIAPPAGEHRLTLVVTADGKKTEQQIKFKTVTIHRENPEDTQDK